MPLLTYCVARAPSLLTSSAPGVAGAEISQLENHGLNVFFSRAVSPDVWLRAPLRDSAMQFHRVLLSFFDSGAIIPFRFPTIIDSEQALLEHLEQRATKYNALLENFANKAQMDIRIAAAALSQGNQRSGKEFLVQRQGRNQAIDSLVTRIRESVLQFAGDWRQRQIASGIRGFALLSRAQVEQFKNAAAAISVPDELEVRVSGPWPVTEFLDLDGANQS